MKRNAHKPAYPPMDAREYARAQRHYQLPGEPFAELIGVSFRQNQRYRNGVCSIPDSVAKLIRTAVNNQLEPDDIG